MQPTNNTNNQNNLQIVPMPPKPMAQLKKNTQLMAVDNLNKIREIAKQNPGITTTSLTSLTSFGFRFLTTPVNAAIEQMFFKQLNFQQAIKGVVKNGPYKGALVGASNSFIGTGSYFGSLELAASIYSNLSGKPVEESRKSLVVKLTAAISSATFTTPLDYIRIQMQNASHGKLVNYNARNLMRGNLPTALVTIGNFVFGLGLGDNVSNTLKPIVKNDNVRELSSKIFGIYTGNFVFSPVFNLSRQMKYSNCGLHQGLINMGFAYNPAKYDAENYTVNSKLRRLVYGMPLDPTSPEGKEKLTIKPRQYVILSVETLARNYKMGWRGFWTASPLILTGCISLAGATQVAKYVTNQERVTKHTAPVKTTPVTQVTQEVTPVVTEVSPMTPVQKKTTPTVEEIN